MYWGTDVPLNEEVLRQLTAWEALVSIEVLDEPCTVAADLLAQGQVIGWVQGRSEFGPRALGNRSILADPRPPEHKDIINKMVKKRESYRPFAPSVLEERVADYFVVPETQRQFPYMSVVLQVRPECCTELGAVTHVDGTARVQTVDLISNPRYWKLIDAFGRATGVPVLLNTSFNNNAEPIVDSVTDAIVCFLTTDLHALFIGDVLVTKRAAPLEQYLGLFVSLPATVSVRSVTAAETDGLTHIYEAAFSYSGGKTLTIGHDLYDVLIRADGSSTVAVLANAFADDSARVRTLMEDILELWGQRMIVLAPSA